MQPNLDSHSLDGLTIALPLPRPDRTATSKRTLFPAISPVSELERARQSVARTSAGEQIAWLAVTLSAIAVLGVSLWF